MRRLADLVVRWPFLVIGMWIAIAVVLPLTFPSLTEMSQRHPLAILPNDAPSSVAARQMTEAFHESGSNNLLIAAFINDSGLQQADEAQYRKVVDALRDDVTDVTMVQDFFSTPQLRPFLTSKDKTTWVLPIGLAGEMGTPRGYDAYKRVAALVNHNVADGPLKVHVTGPAATVADLTVAGEQDRLPIEIAIAVMVLLVLLVVYRNPITMLLPLVTIGAAFVTAQAAVAGVSDLFGIGVSNQSMIFLSAMIAGAGTDYAVFLISRYHDYLRQGADFDDAVKHALISIGKVITASAATVGVTFIGLSFAKMGVFSTIGVACAIAVGVAYLAAMTLLPAILVLAGPRGWVKPRRELTARFWRRSGVRIVRRPRAHLVGSLLVLAILASCAGLVHYNYDDRKALGPDAPSSMGYAALEHHFPISQAVPEYILIESPRDLRTPRALADLEQMASRVSQLPDISLVSGLTRPTGEVPPEFRATYQAGVVGDRMAQGSQVINDNTKDLNRLQNGAGTLASSLRDVRAQINKVAPSMQRMIDALNGVRSQFGGDKLVKQVQTAAQLVQSVNALGNSIGVNFSSVREMFGWIGPVLAALNGNAVCDASPSCADTRIQFQKLMDARDDGRLDQINSLASQLKGVGDNKSLNATVNQLNNTLTQFSSAVRSMGLDSPGGLQAGLTQVRQGANRLADGSQQVAGGVDQLVGQVKLMGDGLDEAAAFLLAMRNDAADPSMAGFNLPSQILQLDEFKKAASIFISPDGHTARYLVLTNLSPFSTQAMDQVNAITDAARSAQPNTQLSDAKITLGGFPAALRDTRDYYLHDIRFIITMTLIVVLLILMLLLRAIVAPIYLIASVIISYFAALGITVLTFQYLLGQQLHWSVPPLAFVVLVAVGADYNMLLVSRMRDESPRSIRYGIIRTLSSTGGVITAAGLIFAASMSGLLFSSISMVVQGGFLIGIGVLLDTFLVRTITVPAMATLVGRANWWPSTLSSSPRRSLIKATSGKAE
jgi:RND superfamily putative drug exporter